MFLVLSLAALAGENLSLFWLNKLKCARFYNNHTYMPCSHYGLFMHKLYIYLCLCFVVIIAFLWDYREKSWAKIWVISGSLLTALMSTFVVTLFYEEKIVAREWRHSFPPLLPSSFKIFTFFLEIDTSATYIVKMGEGWKLNFCIKKTLKCHWQKDIHTHLQIACICVYTFFYYRSCYGLLLFYRITITTPIRFLGVKKFALSSIFILLAE